MRCPSCGHENPEGASFCGECGSSLSAEATCPECGRRNPAGEKFCHGCGQRLAEPSKPATAADPRSYTPPHLAEKILRDRAALRLLYDLGLRRSEVVGLDVGDFDLDAGTISVVGKGHTQTTKLTLPGPTKEAIRQWLEARGTEPGALFTNLDRAGKGYRLTGTSLYRIVRHGDRAAIVLCDLLDPFEVALHGAGHATGGGNGVDRGAQRFGAHGSLATTGR